MYGYLKEHSMGASLYVLPNDLLGNPYVFTKVGPSQVTVNASTKIALEGVGVDWGQY
jgi:hypothetical protein